MVIEDHSKNLFSYETDKIIVTIEKIKEFNIYNAKNIIVFLEYIYIRVYDTARLSLLKCFTEFL